MADKLKELPRNETFNPINLISVHENYVPVPLDDGILFDPSFSYDETSIFFAAPQAFNDLKSSSQNLTQIRPYNITKEVAPGRNGEGNHV